MILRPKAYTADEIATVDRRIRATCHPKQTDFVFDPASYISLLTGRGAGKTTAELMRLLRRMVSTNDGNCLFIAATRQSAERLVWRDLKRLLSKLGIRAKWSEATLTCELRNGARLMLFGADDRKDINKLRGITYHEVGVDETASIDPAILQELLDEVIGPRMIGALCLIGTPGKALEGLFYEVSRLAGTEHRPYKDRELPEYFGWLKWSSHAWTVEDGAAHGIAEMKVFLAKALELKAKNGWSDQNPVWLREYKGIWIGDDTTLVYSSYRPHLVGEDAIRRGVADGTEWNQWDPEKTSFGMAVLPAEIKDWGFGIGLDCGNKDAFAIEVFGWSYTHPSRTLYHLYEVYKTRLFAKIVAQLLIGDDLDHNKYGGIIGALGAWPDVLVGDFDGAGGSLLTELGTVYGITVVPADKPYKYKNNSIELTNSFLHEGQMKILKGSNLATEMTTLQWVVDQFGRRSEKKSQANHGTDATIYLRDAVAPLLPSAAPPPPPPASDDLPRPRETYGDADQMYAERALY